MSVFLVACWLPVHEFLTKVEEPEQEATLERKDSGRAIQVCMERSLVACCQKTALQTACMNRTGWEALSAG